MDDKRQSEIEVYREEYKNDRYGMGPTRRADVQAILYNLAINFGGNPENPNDNTMSGSLLDVSTGRGETMEFAFLYNFRPIHGTEVVPELCGPNVTYAEAHRLPFNNNAFDHVTCFDVIEHLIPEDTDDCLREIYRVAKRSATISASFRSSVFGGRELHINKRPQPEWDELIKRHWPGAKLIGKAGGSPCWQVIK